MQICQTSVVHVEDNVRGEEIIELPHEEMSKLFFFFIVFFFFYCHKTELKYRSACSSHRHEQVRWMECFKSLKRYRKKEKWRASLSEAHAMLYFQ